MMRAQYDEIARRFINALAQALPEMPRDEVVWRYTFTIGAMLHILDDADHADRIKNFRKVGATQAIRMRSSRSWCPMSSAALLLPGPCRRQVAHQTEARIPKVIRLPPRATSLGAVDLRRQRGVFPDAAQCHHALLATSSLLTSASLARGHTNE